MTTGPAWSALTEAACLVMEVDQQSLVIIQLQWRVVSPHKKDILYELQIYLNNHHLLQCSTSVLNRILIYSLFIVHHK